MTRACAELQSRWSRSLCLPTSLKVTYSKMCLVTWVHLPPMEGSGPTRNPAWQKQCWRHWNVFCTFVWTTPHALIHLQKHNCAWGKWLAAMFLSGLQRKPKVVLVTHVMELTRNGRICHPWHTLFHNTESSCLGQCSTAATTQPLSSQLEHHADSRSGDGTEAASPTGRSSHLPVLPLSSSSSSLSEARKGTAAKSSSSARMRPSKMRPWILQSIPELLHCFIAISMYLWYWMWKWQVTDASDSEHRHWHSGKIQVTNCICDFTSLGRKRPR